jgi:hypothetical protein
VPAGQVAGVACAVPPLQNTPLPQGRHVPVNPSHHVDALAAALLYPALQVQFAGWNPLPAQKNPGPQDAPEQAPVIPVHAPDRPTTVLAYPIEQLQTLGYDVLPAQVKPALQRTHDAAVPLHEAVTVEIDAHPGAQLHFAGCAAPPAHAHPATHSTDEHAQLVALLATAAVPTEQAHATGWAPPPLHENPALQTAQLLECHAHAADGAVVDA